MGFLDIFVFEARAQNGTLFSKEIIPLTELGVFQKQTYNENSRLHGLLSFTCFLLLERFP